MHSHCGSFWDKGCHNPVLREVGILFHLELALAVQSHNSFGRSLQVPLWWLWLHLAFSWRGIQLCQLKLVLQPLEAAGSAGVDSALPLSDPLAQTALGNAALSLLLGLNTQVLAAGGAWRQGQLGSLHPCCQPLPNGKGEEAPPKITSHLFPFSHRTSRSQQQAECAVGWHRDHSLRMQAVPGPQWKRRCQPKELDWKPSVPLCFSAGAKKQHVLALRGCSRNVLSFPNRKKHLEITRDSGLSDMEGRACCGVKGKAKGSSSVTLIPPKKPLGM